MLCCSHSHLQFLYLYHGTVIQVGGAVLLSEMNTLNCTPFLFPGTWALFGRHHNNGLLSLSFPAVKKDDSAFDEVGRLSSSPVGRDPRVQLSA